MRATERAVLDAAERVATAATELGASARGLAALARDATVESGRALGTVEALRTATADIRSAVGLISQVSAQTRLLALNATIVAAHGGGTWRGFGLPTDPPADEAAVPDRVDALLRAVDEAVTALERATAGIRRMDETITGITAAVDGAGGASAGLCRLVEALRTEVTHAAAALRDD
ncbi:hypothetical protein Val02_71690 [Virgisporangium aliadipatigenens]|uniref:Methyl-accepting transducer domain-containing protein n=1 Tax=Virgisporangium aliadipatigenens TaxID=741659 RepID=A0A8J3YTR0_9ACTN|nr:methyl-accepting chemotaxis protein [Virgisporangium aliadipatigenens]GIJ50283.1 hypothetical protein Val02_71690 [Virgisporangium aliadipatigenens]